MLLLREAGGTIWYEARTVQQQGWAGLKNGDFPKQAKIAGFEVFLTADQNLEHQQNLVTSGLFVIILVAVSNALEDLLPVVPAALAAMAEPKAGLVVRVGS